MDMTRRNALLAVAAASMSATEAPAANGQGEARKLLQLRIIMPDGQAVDLKASEVIVDFGSTGKLVVKPEGVLPVVVTATQSGFSTFDTFDPQSAKQPTKPLTGDPFGEPNRNGEKTSPK